MDIRSLYQIYNSNKLVFIVGSEILRTGTGPNAKTLEEAAIEKITGKTDWPRPVNLSNIAMDDAYNNLNGNQVSGVYLPLQARALDRSLVNSIAQLSKVQLIIQTSFDTVLEQTMGADTDVFVWEKDNRTPVHLDTKNGKRKLFYLFGNIDHSMALFEEEQVDCLLNLAASNEINKKNSPFELSFLEYLKDKTLVFIGNNFPDWLMRLLIRTLYNRSISWEPGKAYIINDSAGGIRYQRYFFEKFKIQLVHDHPIDSFLESFQQIIFEEGGFDDHYEGIRVFISYDRNDSEYANALRNELNLRHINVFFDTTDIQTGEHDKQIDEVIKSNGTWFFAAVLSQTIATRPKKDSYAKREEWKRAGNRFAADQYMKENSKGNPSPFVIVPAAIDDFASYLDSLPEFLSSNSILRRSPAEVADIIEKELQKLRHG